MYTLIRTQGFTLVEVLLYIALLSLLMSGVVIASYQLLSSAHMSDKSVKVQQEGDFVLRKIDWVLNGVSVQTMPQKITPYSSTLQLVSNSNTTFVVTLDPQLHSIMLSQNGAAPLPLTSESLHVSALQFHYLPAIGTKPEGIEASTTIEGADFYIKKYLRK